ncbi:MAG: NAD-dependent succinate-semialdehyde dehydrogenase [Alphaproteobacteria bacterium]|jgi:succinate-semialdehyde dehydrogenase/glutarate-semialdehyde dehydrogenase|nr:NAD-dependent succinate-semialdehyde dehydrogenase [Alphaproteobacteria bacterium]
MDIDVGSLVYQLKDQGLFKQQCFINGEWVDSDNGDTFDVINPSDLTIVGTMPNASKTETIRAIDAANTSWSDWKKLTGKDRSIIIRRWHQLILDNIDDLALIMTLENGKPIADSRGEIVYASWFTDWFSEEAKRTYGKTIPSTMAGRRIMTIKQPIGVCGIITPWNFPAAMITRKVAPALAAGCPVVIKPAGSTPFSATALVELAHRAGVPKGVINLISVSEENVAEVGDELCTNKDVRKISFTGSTIVGRSLIAKTASTIKKVSMELGGHAPLIIFEDADIDEAVEGAMANKYRNSGQVCVSANRIFVHEKIYDNFAKILSEKSAALKVSDGREDGAQIGPLITMSAVNKVQSHVDDAVEKGATVMTGGSLDNAGKQFFKPTVMTNVTNKMKIFYEETFGPVAPLIKFSTEEEVIKMANDTNYGLAGYFYSRDIGRIYRVAEALEYGMIGINAGVISSEVAPFGGIKESGIGREGAAEGIDEYLETKYMMFAGIDS